MYLIEYLQISNCHNFKANDQRQFFTKAKKNKNKKRQFSIALLFHGWKLHKVKEKIPIFWVSLKLEIYPNIIGFRPYVRIEQH